LSGAGRLSRRQALRLLACLAGGAALAAEKPKPSGDNGIGGTGYKPADNGIGGTGFIGAIRKFGSVWVNGERIAYPADVRIRIDDEPAVANQMRIGQVARLVAAPRDGVLTTDRIVILSEVVGPVSRIEKARLEVLGQSVELKSARMGRGLKVGDRVAVSGLRKPDQTIVASLVEKRDPGPDQIIGVLERDAGGAFYIGAQAVTGVGAGVVGQRVILRGTSANGAFAALETKLDTLIEIGPVKSLSVETWVTRRDGEVVTASGVRVEHAQGIGAGSSHVVIKGELGPNGALIAGSVERPTRRGDFAPPTGRGGPGGAGAPSGPGGGAGRPSAPSGPGPNRPGGPSGGTFGPGGGAPGGGSPGVGFGGGSNAPVGPVFPGGAPGRGPGGFGGFGGGFAPPR
jgi:hypothetical protein